MKGDVGEMEIKEVKQAEDEENHEGDISVGGVVRKGEKGAGVLNILRKKVHVMYIYVILHVAVKC